MSANKSLVAAAFVAIGATAASGAQNGISPAPARMTLIAAPNRSFTRSNPDEAGLVTIFNNLAAKYPKGEFWCCSGYNVMGPSVGEQWMAAAFTPLANHTATKVEVAAGWSQGTNGIVISLNKDSSGMPGKALKTWNFTGLQNFGTCCMLVVRTDKAGIPLTAGKQYWVVLSTNGQETDTVDAWNVDDTDQIDSTTLASYTNNQWTVFPASPGVAFAVMGTN
jgi:hypothetical protein